MPIKKHIDYNELKIDAEKLQSEIDEYLKRINEYYQLFPRR